VGFSHAWWGMGALSIPPARLPACPRQIELVGWLAGENGER